MIYGADKDEYIVGLGLALFSDSKRDPVRYIPYETDCGLDDLAEFEREVKSYSTISLSVDHISTCLYSQNYKQVF